MAHNLVCDVFVRTLYTALSNCITGVMPARTHMHAHTRTFTPLTAAEGVVVIPRGSVATDQTSSSILSLPHTYPNIHTHVRYPTPHTYLYSPHSWGHCSDTLMLCRHRSDISPTLYSSRPRPDPYTHTHTHTHAHAHTTYLYSPHSWGRCSDTLMLCRHRSDIFPPLYSSLPRRDPCASSAVTSPLLSSTGARDCTTHSLTTTRSDSPPSPVSKNNQINWCNCSVALYKEYTFEKVKIK